MPLESCTLPPPPPFSSLMCTNIRPGTGGRVCACMLCVWQQRAVCVFEESSSSSLGSQAWAKTRTGQWQSAGCVTKGNSLFIHSVCTNLIYRDKTGHINLCMWSWSSSLVYVKEPLSVKQKHSWSFWSICKFRFKYCTFCFTVHIQLCLSHIRPTLHLQMIEHLHITLSGKSSWPSRIKSVQITQMKHKHPPQLLWWVINPNSPSASQALHTYSAVFNYLVQ